jgi:hypothetical protein
MQNNLGQSQDFAGEEELVFRKKITSVANYPYQLSVRIGCYLAHRLRECPNLPLGRSGIGQGDPTSTLNG